MEAAIALAARIPAARLGKPMEIRPAEKLWRSDNEAHPQWQVYPRRAARSTNPTTSAICLAKYGGTAFPTCVYWEVLFPMKT